MSITTVTTIDYAAIDEALAKFLHDRDYRHVARLAAAAQTLVDMEDRVNRARIVVATLSNRSRPTEPYASVPIPVLAPDYNSPAKVVPGKARPKLRPSDLVKYPADVIRPTDDESF